MRVERGGEARSARSAAGGRAHMLRLGSSACRADPPPAGARMRPARTHLENFSPVSAGLVHRLPHLVHYHRILIAVEVAPSASARRGRGGGGRRPRARMYPTAAPSARATGTGGRRRAADGLSVSPPGNLIHQGARSAPVLVREGLGELLLKLSLGPDGLLAARWPGARIRAVPHPYGIASSRPRRHDRPSRGHAGRGTHMFLMLRSRMSRKSRMSMTAARTVHGTNFPTPQRHRPTGGPPRPRRCCWPRSRLLCDSVPYSGHSSPCAWPEPARPGPKSPEHWPGRGWPHWDTQRHVFGTEASAALPRARDGGERDRIVAARDKVRWLADRARIWARSGPPRPWHGPPLGSVFRGVPRYALALAGRPDARLTPSPLFPRLAAQAVAC